MGPIVTFAQFACAVLTCALLDGTPSAAAVVIPRTITVDGDTSDWEAVDLNGDTDTDDAGEASILTNEGQFAEDARGSLAGDCSTPLQPGEDLDCEVQATGATSSTSRSPSTTTTCTCTCAAMRACPTPRTGGSTSTSTPTG